MGPVLDEPLRAVAEPLVPQLPDVGGELSFLPLFGVQLGDGVLVGGPGGGVEAGSVGGHALLEVDRASPI